MMAPGGTRVSLARGTRIGDWVVEEEEAEADDHYRCHRVDTPFRKAVLRAVRASDAELLQREARALASLEHPNIQGVIGLTTSGDDLFLVAEAVVGTRLPGFVRQPALPLRAAIDIGLQLADALRAAHARGVTHGDVRPENVLLTTDGRALLTGFQLRHAIGDVPPPSAYVAPEVGRTSQNAGVPPEVIEQRIDAYAFGVLLHELLAGARVPNVEAQGRTALSVEVDVPDVLRDVVAKLTHPDPVARATVGEARESLGFALRDETLIQSDPGAGAAETTYVDTAIADDERPTPTTIGRYEVNREIGRGGVGVVYEARDPGLERRVALKVLLAGNFARARDIERFLREARAVAQLAHPNIVRILEFDREDGSAWFAMEYVDGPTLLERIREDGPLEPASAVEVAASLARALEHAHDAGLLHRDVKPNNVLLEDGQVPRLTDFGLAVSTNSAEATRLTRTGQVLGTPMYMSPEQARGDLLAMGPPTDVYGVGVVLYEALTGHAPFEGATPVAIIQQVLEGDPVPPRTHDPNIPRDIEIICLKAMRRRPRDRYASARELAEDLERALRGEPILAAPPSLLENAWWFVRRNRSAMLAAAAAGLAALAVGLGSYATWQGSELRAETQRQEDAGEALEALVDRLVQLKSEDRAEEAERAWTTFLHHPDYRNTRALVDGWLMRADEAAVEQRAEDRLAALGMAYAHAGARADQERALLALARGMREERDLDGLVRAVETLRRRAPDLAHDDEVKALWRDALVSRRELGTAAAVAEGTPVAAVVQALAQTRRTSHRAHEAIGWPGTEAAVALRRTNGRRLTLVAGTPELTHVRTVRLEQPTPDLFPLPGLKPRFLAPRRGGGIQLLAVGDDALSATHTWTGGPLYAVASGDVDGDGLLEHYLAEGRQLRSLRGLVHGDPHPPTNDTNSEINDLLITDLDGDGASELVVAAAEWGAYDIRVLGPGERGGPLQLEARTKLGVVNDLALLPSVAGAPTVLANKQDRYPNLRVFPADRPTGARAGLWRLHVDPAGDLVQEHLLDANCKDLQVADLDGNGIADAVANCQEDMVVLVQGADGVLHDLWFRQLSALATLNVDQDDALELLVADPADDDAVWVFGSGDDAPPQLAQTEFDAQDPPDEVPETFAAAWRRSEDLAFMGQIRQAASTMVQLGEQHLGRPGGRAAILRAADLHDARGAYPEAAALYQQASEGATREDVAAASRAAARAFRRAHDPAAELEVLRALANTGSLEDEEAQRLTALAVIDERPHTTIDFAEPLADGWRILNPLALHRESDGDLRFEAFGRSELAELPVVWDGGPLELQVDLTIDRSEWAGGFEIALAPPETDGRFAGVRFAGRGGGEVVERWLTCWSGGRVEVLTLPRTADRTTVTMRVYGNEQGLACEARSEAWAPLLGVKEGPARAGQAGTWTLVLRSTGNPDTLVTGLLHRIELRGASIAPSTSRDRLDPARRALVDGDPATAARLAAPYPSDLMLDMAIAAEMDDGVGLRRTLRRAMEQGVEHAPLTHLLHCRLETLGPELRPLLGRTWAFWISSAWGTTLASHATDPEVGRMMFRHLDGLEAVAGRTNEERATLLVLNASRLTAAVAAGRHDIAQASADRTLELYDQIRDEKVRNDLRRVLARVHLDRAAHAMTGEAVDERAAVAAVAEAVRASAAPEITADMAAVREELAPLHGNPAFRALIEPIRAGRSHPP